MVPENPNEDDVKALLEETLPGWEWVFAEWADGKLMAKHMATQPIEKQEEWVLFNLPDFKEVNQRLAKIGSVIRFRP